MGRILRDEGIPRDEGTGRTPPERGMEISGRSRRLLPKLVAAGVSTMEAPVRVTHSAALGAVRAAISKDFFGP